MDSDSRKSSLKSNLIRILRVLLLVYLLMCFGVYFLQAKLVFVPTVGEPQRTPVEMGIDYENLRLKSGTETIQAWYVPARENRGTVLFCHGNAGNLEHRLSTIRIWHDLGLNIMLFDYRGFGSSSGSPTEQGCYEDAQTCYDWLKENGKLNGPFIIHGRSLGGGIASWAAVNFKNSGLVLESTFTSIPDMGAHFYPFLPVNLISSIKFPNLERVKKLSKPLLVIHGREDEVIPYKMGQALHAAAKSVFIELTGAHNSGFEITPEYKTGLKVFTDKIISQVPSGPE